MATWSQSPFLQALGWAMLNSLWQMALLFVGFNLLRYLFPLTAQRRYYAAIGSLFAGLFWFTYTFLHFLRTGAAGTILAQHKLAPTAQTWNLLLSSASLTYLMLLLVPAYRLAKNWRYIGHLKKFGLQKTAMEYRLFVKKVAQRLGIKHTVHVYLSHLVQSPVTIGYLKPIILLPIAAINQLSPQQVEAVLLHELSHIRRYDYLVNFIIMFLQTIFYFNPFVKGFVSIIEFEREKCCDELVLQFEYDKISYASALLLLEKTLLASDALILAAAGKNHLLRRIETILGLKEKVQFSFQHFAGLLASALVVVFINSLFFVKKEVKINNGLTFAAFENPLYQFEAVPVTQTFSKPHLPAKSITSKKPLLILNEPSKKEPVLRLASLVPSNVAVIPVGYDALDEMVTSDEKAHIEQTLETTKNVLAKTKWNELEASIGDGMTAGEKKTARNEYLKAVDKIDWKTLESHLKSEYNALNWVEITSKLESAINELKLDSLQTTFHQILREIKESEGKLPYKMVLPIPDASTREVDSLKEQLKARVDSIQIFRGRRIINF